MTDLDEVVKNPLSPVEHPGGVGVNCEMFELGVEQFVVSLASKSFLDLDADDSDEERFSPKLINACSRAIGHWSRG